MITISSYQLILIYCIIGLLIGYFAHTQISERLSPRERLTKAVQMGIGWPFVVMLIIALLIEDLFEWVFGVEWLDDDEENE